MGALYIGPPLTPQLPRFKARLAEFRAGTRDLSIAVVGTSLERGTNSAAGTAQALQSWPVQLAQQLAAVGYNTNFDSIMACGGTVIPTASDSRIAATGAWVANTSSPGGLLFRANNGAGTLSFTPSNNVDRFEVLFARTGQTGSVTVNINGGAVLHTHSNGAAAFPVSSGVLNAPSLGANTINIVWVAGNVYVHSIRAWNSTSGRRIDIYNYGWAGAEFVGNWDQAPNVYSPRNGMAALAHDLIVCVPGPNDLNNGGGETAAQFATSVTQCLDSWMPGSDVILATFPPLITSWSPTLTQNDYVSRIRTIADGKRLPLVDSYARRVSQAATSSLYNADGVHGNQTGYGEIATAVRNMLANAAGI